MERGEIPGRFIRKFDWNCAHTQDSSPFFVSQLVSLFRFLTEIMKLSVVVSLSALLLSLIGTLADDSVANNGLDDTMRQDTPGGRLLGKKESKGKGGKGDKGTYAPTSAPKGGKGKGGKGSKGAPTSTMSPTSASKSGKGGSKGDKGEKKQAKGEKKSKGGTKESKSGKKGSKGKYFNRISSFLVCSQLDPTCNIDDETVAEIVAVSEDENTILYTNGAQGGIGFVDITDPSEPVGMGYVVVGGEPKSVGVAGGYALAAVNTSPDFINPSGELIVIDIEAKEVVHTIDLGGQPDAVAISPDGKYAGVVIENERDEDLGDGGLPQLPAGYFVIVDMQSMDPLEWTTTNVYLEGLEGLVEPSDPEPEYVSINKHNLAVITLQENNAIVLVDMETATVTNSFSAGYVDLQQIDTIEEGALILQDSSLEAIPREPDGVTWIGNHYFATADEGDWNGGSRGFTIFNTDGDIVFTSGNELEHLTASIGHYPDERSEDKGCEPENVFYGKFGKDHLLFVNIERSSVVAVYDVYDPTHPEFVQVLPSGVGPEGGVALPNRNLAIVASEVDERDNKIRSVINIYSRGYKEAHYPTIQSLYRDDDTPIPFSALSGLAPDPEDDCILYSIEDSFFLKSRIFHIDVCTHPAALYAELRIVDTNDVFAEIDEFDLINDDKTVNIDPEGIAVMYDDDGYLHYYVASEGSGSADDLGTLNLIFQIDHMGVIEDVFSLPDDVNAKQVRFGFEGVAEYEDHLFVAFQRAWDGEDHPRIGIYDLWNDVWSFVFYPLDETESQRGGWVGLSDITPLGGGQFLVLERDNQGGPDAVIKRIYKIDLSDYEEDELVEKELYRDIVPDISEQNGLIFEKVEGLAYNHYGVWFVNDNDGVDDNSGEMQLIHLEH